MILNVPEDWTVQSLSSIAKVSIGLVTTMTEHYVNSGVPLIRNSDIKENRITKEKLINLNPAFAEQYPTRTLNVGDIVTVHTGDVGVSAKIDDELNGCLGFATLNTRVNLDMVDPEYLCWYFNNPRFLAHCVSLSTGDGRQNLNLKDFAKVQVPIPPLPEQQKIAHILSTWDKAITTIEQLLAISQLQKKALMQQLLTGKKRLLDKNGVRYSGEWCKVSLSTICEINPKKSPSPEDGKVSFIAMEAVSEDAKLLSSVIRDYSDVSKGFTSFSENDVLIAKITPCFENGKGAYVEGMQNGIGFGSTEFHVLRAGANSDSKYLYFLTNTSEFRVRGEANMQGSAGQKRVTTDYLKSLKVTVPTDVNEQKKIAAVLSIADQEVSVIQQKLDALKQEKKALMQQLLTGKRRVNVNA